MSSNNHIRVFAALAFSIIIHIGVMGLDIGGDSPPVAGIIRQKVRVQLVARRPSAIKPVVVPAGQRRKTEEVRSVLPTLPRPVEVAVREVPTVSLPTAPKVPELASSEDDLPVKPEAISGVAESSKPAVVMARPLYRDNPPPEYPDQARRRQLQGTVVLEVSVSREGKVEQLAVHEGSGHNILDRAALAAVKEWLFEPGERSGKKVAMNVLVPVRFSLR